MACAYGGERKEKRRNNGISQQRRGKGETARKMKIKSENNEAKKRK